MQSVQVGDFVRTETGEHGRVVLVDKRTAWVFFKDEGSAPEVKPFLASKLTASHPQTPGNNPQAIQ